MRIKLVIILAFYSFGALGQQKVKFEQLINELNHYLEGYSKLTGFEHGTYYPIANFGLSKQEEEELIKESDYDENLTPNKDSIASYEMIFYLQDKIITHLKQIIKHPDLQKNDIEKLIKDELGVIVSDDKKLYNFSLDEKTGGTYRSRISMMHYTDMLPKDSTQA